MPKNSLLERLNVETPLPFTAQLQLTAPLSDTGDRQYMALFTGQAAGLIVEKPAGDLVNKLAKDAEYFFNRFVT